MITNLSGGWQPRKTDPKSNRVVSNDRPQGFTKRVISSVQYKNQG